LKSLLTKTFSGTILLNLLGLDYKIGIRYSTEDKMDFCIITKNLLTFPIVHVLTNENDLEGIGYFHRTPFQSFVGPE